MGEQVLRLAEEVLRLERELAQQRQLRAHQAQRAHTQAQAVRLWVAQRLRQLEEHNTRLQEQNERCNEQLEELRRRLAQLSEQLAASAPPDDDEAPPAYTAAVLHPTSCPGVRLERKRFREVTTLSSCSSMASPEEDGTAHKGWPSPALEGCRRGVVAPDEELHDYAEIYTPSREEGPAVPGSDTGRPPTPPRHRFPSWESRIYEVAANGIIQSLHSGTSGASSLEGTLPGSRLHSAFSELSVPVYAAVKGRASQIRSMPFTGESSDSSDNEDTSRTPLSGSSDRSPKAVGVRRETSAESLLSDDYAVPPDAVSTTADTLSLDSLEPHPPVVSRGTQESLYPALPEPAEKSGYLTKLGGKLKTWKRRWFVLANGTLRYYKAQSDVGRKPRGQIALDEVCRVTRAHGATTFEIATDKRSFYLTADCTSTMEEWVRVLQQVLRNRQLGSSHGAGEAGRPTVDGWVTKVKHGHARRCWGALIGRTFFYYRAPDDTNPLGQIPLRDARVEEVLHLSDSDDDEAAADKSERSGTHNTQQQQQQQQQQFTVALLPRNQSPTYLLFPTRQEMDAWLYHLTVVSSGENASGSQYEQLISRLLEVDGDPGSVVWRHPLLLHSKEPLSQPLTSLASEELQSQALRLFKSVQLFMGVPLEASGIDYHVALAQNSLAQCLSCPALQNELFCQLIKQTSPLPGGHRLAGVQQLLLCATQSLFLCDSSSEKGSPTTDKAGGTPPPPAPAPPCHQVPPPPSQQPADWVLVQGWQLLSLAVALFPPRNRTRWLLRKHLLRHADSRSEPGQYASFCGRALERALKAGSPRECRPSRMEVLSILQRNPFHHSLPHSIPVHFLNGTYLVVGFDGSTTVDEFIGTLTQEAGMRDPSQSGFALYSDDPIDKGVQHCLNLSTQKGDSLLADEGYQCGTLKLCDVISRWEQALRERHLGKVENTRVICLTFKNRLFLRQHQKAETERERLLTCYALHRELMQGRFPLTHEMALEMAALMAQIEYGDHSGERARSRPQLLQQALERFLPQQFLLPDNKSQQDSLGERWAALRGRPAQDCVRIYLNCVRKWPLCGARLFAAKMKSKEQQSLWLAVSEDGISLLDCVTLQPWVQHPYSSVMTFGGCQEDFMLVVCPEAGEPCTERLLFAMPKAQVLEVTLLVADYMNALGATGASVAPSPGGSLVVGSARSRLNMNPCSATSSPALSTASSRRPLLPTPDS
ncbi:uncharacterized protein CG43867 isoform X1 [Rhipicephalus microplus]|uniref:uncharacterized protein CG43867 isoform X1 n=1 Tax=Rhipicephalus microplus TaxID=6941 RepID=UPI003F6C3079